MNNKLNIAQIYGEYNHPVQPYLKKVSESLLNNGLDIKICSFGKTQQSTKNIYELGSTGQQGKRLRLLKALFANPSLTRKWLFSQKNGISLRGRGSIWADYYPLLVQNPNIIHLLNSYTYSKLSTILELLNSTSIVSFRGFDTVVRPLTDDKWKYTLQEIFKKVDYLHYVSLYLQKQGLSLGAPIEKSFVIYPSVDVDFFSPNKKSNTSNSIKLITTGRLTWQKGLPTALHAIKILAEKGYSVEYKIIGDGVEADHLVFLAHEYQLGKRVRFLGLKKPEEVRDLLNESDIYIHPSITEAIPVAVLEASAMELPVIASDVGGIPEAVIDNITGNLIPCMNPERLAEAIIELHLSPDKRIRMGNEGRKFISQKFSLEVEVRHWTDFYNNISLHKESNR